MVKISIVPRSLALTIGFHRMTQSDFNHFFLCGFAFNMGTVDNWLPKKNPLSDFKHCFLCNFVLKRSTVPRGLAPTMDFQRMTPKVT